MAGAKPVVTLDFDRKGDLAVSPDGGIAVRLGTGGVARFYRTDDGTEDGPGLDVGQDARISGIGPGAKRVVIRGPGPGLLRVWDRATGRPVELPLGRTAEVIATAEASDVVFSPDGSLLTTAHRDGTARVWEAETGLPLGPPLRSPEGVTFLRFSPDGRRLLVGGVGWKPGVPTPAVARVWDLSPSVRPVAELADEARLVANRRIDDRGLLVPLTAADERELWERWSAAREKDGRR